MKSSELVRLLRRDGWFIVRQNYENYNDRRTNKDRIFSIC
jgi:hypothetical protein